MGRISLVCPNCGCIFGKAFYAKDKMYVECPHCHNREKVDHYTETEYETNPIKAIGEFKHILQDADNKRHLPGVSSLRDTLKQYFIKTVKKYHIDFRNDGIFFTNLEEKEVSVSEVHDFIISDEKYWEALYNMWMTFYR